MKYKAIACAVAVLMVATPVFAQKMSPIVVDTGRPVPSIVRTGEPFSVTYRARYTDIVLIVEEQMRFSDLLLTEDKKGADSAPQVNTEVVGLVIGEKHRVGSEDEGFFTVQDFTYTFRVINERKGNYKVPSFDFIWVQKKAGVTASEARDKEELRKFATEEVGVSYLSTIVKPPLLDIRDGSKFEGFAGLSDDLTDAAYIFYVMIGFWVLIVVVRFFRSPKVQKVAEKDSAKAPEGQPEELLTALPFRTRKDVLRELKKLLRHPRSLATPPDLEKKVFILLRGLFVGELSEEPVKALASDTPSELNARLTNLDSKQIKAMSQKHYAVFLELSKKLRNYYEDIESGSLSNFEDPKGEIERLVDLIYGLSRTRRFLKAAKSYLQFLREYLEG